MENQTGLKKILYSQIIILVLIVAYFVATAFWDVGRVFFLLLAVLGLAFLVLGVILALKARKEKGKLRVFLLLAGLSAVAPLVFSILHNLFYALAEVSKNVTLLKYLFEFLHGASFIIALLVAPVAFIAGAVGSLMLLKKKVHPIE